MVFAKIKADGGSPRKIAKVRHLLLYLQSPFSTTFPKSNKRLMFTISAYLSL